MCLFRRGQGRRENRRGGPERLDDPVGPGQLLFQVREPLEKVLFVGQRTPGIFVGHVRSFSHMPEIARSASARIACCSETAHACPQTVHARRKCLSTMTLEESWLDNNDVTVI